MDGKEKVNNSVFILSVGCLIGLGRGILGYIAKDNEQIITFVMAIVNYVALGFVLLFLYNGFSNDFNGRLAKAGLSSAVKKRRKGVKRFIGMILVVVYSVSGMLYIAIFYNADGNDVLSIIALAISIANDGLIEYFGGDFFKIIKKLSKT